MKKIIGSIICVVSLSVSSLANAQSPDNKQVVWKTCVTRSAMEFAILTDEPAETVVKAAFGKCETEAFEYIATFMRDPLSAANIKRSHQLLDNEQELLFNTVLALVLDARAQKLTQDPHTHPQKSQ